MPPACTKWCSIWSATPASTRRRVLRWSFRSPSSGTSPSSRSSITGRVSQPIPRSGFPAVHAGGGVAQPVVARRCRPRPRPGRKDRHSTAGRSPSAPRPGGGATFTVRLPLHGAQPPSCEVPVALAQARLSWAPEWFACHNTSLHDSPAGSPSPHLLCWPPADPPTTAQAPSTRLPTLGQPQWHTPATAAQAPPRGGRGHRCADDEPASPTHRPMPVSICSAPTPRQRGVRHDGHRHRSRAERARSSPTPCPITRPASSPTAATRTRSPPRTSPGASRPNRCSPGRDLRDDPGRRRQRRQIRAGDRRVGDLFERGAYRGRGPAGHLRPWLDFNNAHVQPTGEYHYHGISELLVDAYASDDDLVLVGFAADGHLMYYSKSGAYAPVATSCRPPHG